MFCAVTFVPPERRPWEALAYFSTVETGLAPSCLRGGCTLPETGQAPSLPESCYGLRGAFERGGEGIERERAQQVATQAALDFGKTLRGALHPGEVGRFGQFLEFAQNIRIADQLCRTRLQEHQVFEQGVESAEQSVDFLTAFGSGPIGLGYFEQLGVVAVAAAYRGFQHDERV